MGGYSRGNPNTWSRKLSNRYGKQQCKELQWYNKDNKNTSPKIKFKWIHVDESTTCKLWTLAFCRLRSYFRSIEKVIKKILASVIKLIFKNVPQWLIGNSFYLCTVIRIFAHVLRLNFNWSTWWPQRIWTEEICLQCEYALILNMFSV